MLFNIENDFGTAIEGYLVPDGFSEQPGIVVFDGPEAILTMDCDQLRAAIQPSGRHATGIIGFKLTEDAVPGLAERRRLAIRDRKTGILIYRRPSPEFIRKKIFRMESRLAAFPKIDKFLGDRFQYSIHEAERFGQETALQAFHLHGQESIYVSGRLLVRNFEEFLEKGFHFVTMIGEPYQELADRMLLFRRLAAMPERALGERDRMILGLAIEHFAEVDIDSDRALKRALRHLQPAVKRVLTAPLTRQLVATYPEQAATRASLAAAMDTLSRFTVVGLVEHPETFTAPLGELLELDPLDIPAPAAHPETTALAERLRRLHDAELLLELDLILYHFARETVLRYREWPAQDATRSANSPN